MKMVKKLKYNGNGMNLTVKCSISDHLLQISSHPLTIPLFLSKFLGSIWGQTKIKPKTQGNYNYEHHSYYTHINTWESYGGLK